MTLRRYLLTMAITTLICWAAFVMVLFRINPETAGAMGMAFFFVSLFFSVWGTVNLLGFGARYLLLRHTVPFTYIGTALRQSFWLALLLNTSLLLAVNDLFAWWLSFLLLIGLIVLETFFIARSIEHQPQHKRRVPLTQAQE